MKLLLFVLILIGSVNSFSQPDSVYTRQLTIGVNAGPCWSYRSLSNYNLDYSVSWYSNFRRTREFRRVGYGVDVPINFRFNKWLGLSSGLGYSSIGFTRPDVTLTDEMCITELGRGAATYQMDFITLPLQVEFRKKWDKFEMSFKAGISLDLMVQNRIKIETAYYGDWKEDEILKFDRDNESVCWYAGLNVPKNTPFYLAGLLNMNFAYLVNSRLGITVSPIFRYQFTSTLESPVKERLGALGVQLGLQYTVF